MPAGATANCRLGTGNSRLRRVARQIDGQKNVTVPAQAVVPLAGDSHAFIDLLELEERNVADGFRLTAHGPGPASSGDEC